MNLFEYQLPVINPYYEIVPEEEEFVTIPAELDLNSSIEEVKIWYEQNKDEVKDYVVNNESLGRGITREIFLRAVILLRSQNINI